MKKTIFTLSFLIINIAFVFAQKAKTIVIENSDFSDINQFEVPDAVLLTGNVRLSHDGAIMTCNKAYYYQKEN